MVRTDLIGPFSKILTRAALSAMVALGLLISCTPAFAGEPPTEPFLRLETGMHSAVIRGISVDAAGHLLLTVSDDKTARVWSVDDGRLLRSCARRSAQATRASSTLARCRPTAGLLSSADGPGRTGTIPIASIFSTPAPVDCCGD